MADEAGERSRFQRALELYAKEEIGESGLNTIASAQSRNSGNIYLYRGVPSDSLQIGRPFTEADSARLTELENMSRKLTDQELAEGEDLFQRKRSSGGQFFTDQIDIARNYAGESGSIHTISVPAEEYSKFYAGEAMTPRYNRSGYGGIGYSSNFFVPTDYLKNKQAQGQIISTQIPRPQMIVESSGRPRGPAMVIDRSEPPPYVPEQPAVSERGTLSRAELNRQQRVLDKVTFAIDEQYRVRAPTINPVKRVMRQLDRRQLQRDLPGVIRPGHSYYLHTIRTATPERMSSIVDSINEHGLFYRHYGNRTGLDARVRPFLLGPLSEDPMLGNTRGGMVTGQGSEYTKNAPPSTRTFIIELPDSVTHVDEVGTLITPDHPLYDTAGDARSLRAGGKPLDPPAIGGIPGGGTGGRRRVNQAARRFTGVLPSDFIVGHIEDGRFYTKADSLSSTPSRGVRVGRALGIAAKALGRSAGAAGTAYEFGSFLGEVGRHGPIEGSGRYALGVAEGFGGMAQVPENLAENNPYLDPVTRKTAEVLGAGGRALQRGVRALRGEREPVRGLGLDPNAEGLEDSELSRQLDRELGLTIAEMGKPRRTQAVFEPVEDEDDSVLKEQMAVNPSGD